MIRGEMMQSDIHEHFMQLALNEAQRGLGRTSPNPCVGAVIVKGGQVISKGYHEKAGMPHAEIVAIRNAENSDCIVGASIYVTLEPCNHTGRTPPCSRAIVESGIENVIVGMTDPNPAVNGTGIDYLRDHGVSVVSGVLQQKCEAINYPFIKHITQGLPWTILKAGASLDGRLNYQRGSAGWITGEETGKEVHRLRDSVDAILIGSRTLAIDNPSLTTRLLGRPGKDPARIVLDTHLTSSRSAKIFHLESEAPTILFCSADIPSDQLAPYQELGAKVFQVATDRSGLVLQQVLEKLGRNDICSVLIEGGATIHGAFLQKKLVDYAHIFYAPIFAGDQGVSLLEGLGVACRENAPYLSGVEYKRVGEDLMVSGRLAYQT